MDALDRLYQRILHNIRTSFPEYLHRPFTIQELHEQIIPYRHNRKELGMETNQDYEAALTRLLTGERGYIKTDGAVMERLRNDLADPHGGDTGLFREFGNASVSVERIENVPTPPSAPHPSFAPPSEQKPAISVAPAISSLATVAVPEGCRYCGGTLPDGREITYCPHCGQNLSVVRCPGCGSEVEPGWKFCVTCGRASSR
jgi:hypothetical protein